MTFSILTPSFNQGAFLERNIQSVLGQDVAGTQHIICDGGSTDTTVDILKKHADQLYYWVSEKDAGQADALNKALAKATNPIVGWLNVDEYYEPNIFKAVADAFASDPRVVLVYGDFRRVLPDGKEIRVNRQWRFDYDVCRVKAPIVMNCAAFFRRDRLLEVGGFDPSWQFIMDWELYIRLMRGDQQWRRLRRVLGNFTMHPESKTATLQDKFHAEWARLIQREWPGITAPQHARLYRKQHWRMIWHMLLDGVLPEKLWFNAVRRKRYASYFGDEREPKPLADRLFPANEMKGS